VPAESVLEAGIRAGSASVSGQQLGVDTFQARGAKMTVNSLNGARQAAWPYRRLVRLKVYLISPKIGIAEVPRFSVGVSPAPVIINRH
jgi:hypothetical protein